jgi:hypothetical protein
VLCWLRMIVLLSFVATAMGQAGPSLKLRHPRHSTFGKPVSTATGNEVVPQNQGFLQCVADKLSPVYRNIDTSALVQNFQLGVSDGSDAVIVGHGVPGIICTGDGDSCFGYPGQMLGSFNIPDWQQGFQQLSGKFRSITLIACDAGQADGTALLSAIAQATKATVIAPDTIVSCGPDGITLAPGGKWVQVTPGSSKTLPAPGRRHIASSKTSRFRMSSEFVTIPSNRIRISEFQHRTYLQREFQRLDISRQSELSRLIDFANPIITKARPGAIVTGHIIIAFPVADRSVRKDFILYNDRLLEDSDDLDVFYDTDSTFFDTVKLLAQ